MDQVTQHELPLDPDAEILGATTPLHFQLRLVGAVALGALPGTLARYFVSRAWTVGPNAFPFSTFVVNLSGAFLLGLILEALVRRGDDRGTRRDMRLLIGTGFCGAFTTYSTLAIQSDLLFHNDHLLLGVGYAIFTVLGGLAASTGGIIAAAGDHRRRQRRPPDDPDLAQEG